MRYTFKTFWHSAPRKNNNGTFIYGIVYQIIDTQTNTTITDYVELSVPSSTTNVDTDPYIMNNIMMRINMMWNKI